MKTALMTRRVMVLWVLLALFSLVLLVLARLYTRPTAEYHLNKSGLAAVNGIAQFIRPLHDQSDEITPKEYAQASRRLGLSAGQQHTLNRARNRLNDALKELYTSGWLGKQYWFDSQAWMAQLPKKDYAVGLTWLRKMASADFLRKLEWKERTPKRLREKRFVSGTLVMAAETLVKIPNPWDALPGCVFMQTKDDSYRFLNAREFGFEDLCRDYAKRMQPPQAIEAIKPSDPQALPSARTILSGLSAYRDPESILYHELVGRDSVVELGGADVAAGLNVILTIDPDLQALAQTVAQCYTGDPKGVCQAMGMDNPGKGLYENAKARMAGIAIIDIASGEIRAAASAHSPCFAAWFNGRRTPKKCPDLGRPRIRFDRLLNHALFTDLFPASTIKPIMALGLLAADHPPGDQWLQKNIKRSLTPAFFDHLFCIDGAKANQRKMLACRRAAKVLEAAHWVGWNMGCGQPGEDCGKLDLLFGVPLAVKPQGYAEQGGRHYTPVRQGVLYGRFMISPAADGLYQFRDMSSKEMRLTDYRIKKLKECRPGRYEQCRGNPVVNEGWGQGQTRATPLGVAGMLARLGAAANGQTAQRRPHLVRQLTRSNGKRFLAGPEKQQLTAPVAVEIDQEHARRIVRAMALTHRPSDKKTGGPGTAFRACQTVFGNQSLEGVAGKTGTPTVPYKTLAARKKACNGENPSANCGILPWKWYAALVKTDPAAAHYDIALAVALERNWNMKTGALDDLHEQNNAAAQIAFQIIKRIRGE